jgi:uncharacterized protein (DUF1697 family)
MPAYAAFLRAVNVGGRAIRMADLREEVEAAGFERVGTILQSGTVVFCAPKARPERLEDEFETLLRRRFGVNVPVVVRTEANVTAIVKKNPFARQAKDDPARLVALVLKSAPAKTNVEALRASIRGREQIAAEGDVLYAYYPDGQGESKLTAAVIDRALGTVCTARNWNTISKIAAALEERA